MALGRKSKIGIGLGLVLLIALVLALAIFGRSSNAPEVTVVKVESQPELKSTVTAPGEIRPVDYINLTSEVQGRIEEIYVKEGDVVDKGQQLVRLDPNQLQSSTDAQLAAYQASQNDLQSSRSQVTAAQNSLSQAQQGLNAQEAAVSTALQQVATAEESVNQARQQAVAATTDVNRQNVALNAAKRELKRTEELLESGVASRLEYDQAKDLVSTSEANLANSKALLKARNIAVREAQNRVKEAKARVNESRARAKQQQVAVRDARRSVSTASFGAKASSQRASQQAAVLRGQRNQRDKTLQVAPIAGIIAEIPSKVGTFATANLSSTPLLTIADMSTINVEVKVDETEIDRVSIGQSTVVKVDAFGDKEIKGIVRFSTPLGQGKNQTSGGLTSNINTAEAKEFKVVVELQDIDDEIRKGLRPGMSATAVITTDVRKDVTAVPIQAVIEKKAEDTEEGKVKGDAEKPKGNKEDEVVKGVFIMDGKKAKFLEVTTGITGESDYEITSGLEAGQEVITGPSRVLNKLKEGDQVRRQEKKEGEKSD